MNLSPSAMCPEQGREDVIGWITHSWNHISSEMVTKAFQHIAFSEDIATPSSIAHPSHHFTDGCPVQLDDSYDVEDTV